MFLLCATSQTHKQVHYNPVLQKQVRLLTCSDFVIIQRAVTWSSSKFQTIDSLRSSVDWEKKELEF